MVALFVALLVAEPFNLVTAAPTAGGTAAEFRVGGRMVTRYVHAGEKLAKPYCLPLLAPGGVPVTRGWPVERGAAGGTTDHVHHKSVWFCHGDVIPEGLTWSPRSANTHVTGVDFWSEEPGHGRIVCDRVRKPEQLSGKAARVVTENRWLTPDGQVVLTEVRALTVSVGDAQPVLAFDIALTAAVPVRFGDTKEGAFGVRVHDQLALTTKAARGAVTSSTGKTAAAPAKDDLPFWGEAADWHDYSGVVDGEPVGVAVFDHPENPHRAAWHTRAYGLVAANPFARAKSGFPGRRGQTDEVRLAKGETLKLRYAVYPHTGDAAAGRVAAVYAAFAAGR